MSDIEKRKVHTDALATLGMIIDNTAARDAIHLAVEPAVAGEDLFAGQHVGRDENGSYAYLGPGGKHVGIVDPFLNRRVLKGERFWLIVYPRQITSLRHVWEHPAFENENKAESKRWIESFASRIERAYECGSLTYDELMEYAKTWLKTKEETCLGSESYLDQYDKFPQFWQHYATLTGQNVPEAERGVFFRCAC
jgi:hypothetical protein